MVSFLIVSFVLYNSTELLHNLMYSSIDIVFTLALESIKGADESRTAPVGQSDELSEELLELA